MSPQVSNPEKPLVCAVSYLNTSPLVWGLLRTPMGDSVRLEFALPSLCADRVRDGMADIGIVPVIEMQRQGLDWLPGTGIACRGAVRSILLVSKVPLDRIQSLAGDVGSRTSVMLTRILLAHRYGSTPAILPMRADLEAMLAAADAALIIGDPALLLDPAALCARYAVLDLGEEWVRYTGLPMVFAVWAGRTGRLRPGLAELFAASCRYGMEHLEEILEAECPPRRIPIGLGRTYLTQHVALELNDKDYQGMQLYLRYAREFDNLKETVPNLIQNVSV
ncbi:MAG: menaquinone biosynthesis protein [Bryobacterales bacterium]|nr:menaquinone biosynthesis protein [Bryobacterales bacterium]